MQCLQSNKKNLILKPKIDSKFLELFLQTSLNQHLLKRPLQVKIKNVAKAHVMKVLVLEPFHLSNSGKPEISKIFSQGKYFIQDNLVKTCKFYEFILVDIDLVQISHIQNQNSIDICYSKCKICKVISQKSWGHSPDTHKMFSQKFRLKSYDYHDYIDTWYHTFFFRPFDHSWFFHWGDEIKNQTDFPNWFQEWWLFFGAIKHIFCPQILEGYKYFSKHGSHWFRLPVHKYYFSFQDFKFLGFLVGTLFSHR